MIRHSISKDSLNAAIDATNATWRTRAQQRTNELENGTRKKITGIWSEIKPVYMNLQGPKCAFCEKWIEDQAIEQDVEHFRPKNNVKRWRIPKRLRDEGVTVNQPAAGSEPGYRLLAYHAQNYVAACKTCNSVLKRDYFPIAGARESSAKDPTTLAGEQAYLIFPLGDFDADPEQLIEFHGLSPQPRKAGFERLRALVTIELFQLDNRKKRKELLRDRAELIEKLYFALQQRDNPASTATQINRATAVITRLTSKKSRHTNCLRCYARLWDSNNAEARSVYEKIADFLESTSTS